MVGGGRCSIVALNLWALAGYREATELKPRMRNGWTLRPAEGHFVKMVHNGIE